MHSRRIQSLSRCVCLFAILLILISGCKDEPRGGPRVPTSPITGQVLVDGEPAHYLLVKCHPQGEAAVPTTISGFTDENGRFSISTYEQGDGAPAGEYVLTFMWGEIAIMSGRYGPPDKLDGRYADEETSEYTVTVEEGVPSDVGVIQLTTSDETT